MRKKRFFFIGSEVMLLSQKCSKLLFLKINIIMIIHIAICYFLVFDIAKV